MVIRPALTASVMAVAGGCAESTKATADTGLGSPVDLISYVDPMISTGGIGYSVGSGYPGALVPFGMVKISPDTAMEDGSALSFHHCSGYHADDTHIEGFSHLHMHGTGVPAYGFITAMPVEAWRPEWMAGSAYRAAFDKATEHAIPGRYSVVLQDPEIAVDLTATARTALHRYRFDAAVDTPTVLIDLGHTLIGGTVVSGDIALDPTAGTWSARTTVDSGLGGTLEVWVEAQLDPAPVDWGVWADGADHTGRTEASGTAVGAWFQFDTAEVAMRVALSVVDEAGARGNFAAEHDGFDMEAAAKAARDEWASWLAPFRVWGGSERDRTIFATSVYHTGHMPTVYSDVDGRYRGLDGRIHTAHGFRYHSDFSLWDTYRTTHPLYSLVWPATHLDMLQSLSRMANQGGALPRWPAATQETGVMLGQPAAIVIAEAWQKRFSGFDEMEAFSAAVDSALGRIEPPFGGRPSPDLYDTHGYYPSDLVGRSVSWTQEVAIVDHALAQMARDLGTPAEVAQLTDQASRWRNLYDPETGWFHGRLSDGTFEPPPNPDIWEEEYAEGTARQYLWLVPHDPEGLFEVLGGEEATLARLDEMMEEGAAELEDDLHAFYGTWYWHGNEPGLHIPWLFALAGDVAGTRHWVDYLLDHAYDTAPAGLAGNDDGGTLSAWAVFAAMGIYPLAGTDRYVLGRPRFDRVELHPEGGLPTLTLIRSGDGTDLTVTRDGELWSAPDIRHDDLWTGPTLTFE
jgi:predicted alpha-1,2-mannosidase